MKTIEMKLVNDYAYGFGLGHCQVTYISKNDKGQKLVYCLQEHHGIRLMRCSQDGEPSHEVKFPDDILVKWEMPKGDSETETLAKRWIMKII